MRRMENKENIISILSDKLYQSGVNNVSVIDTKNIKTDVAFRKMCESNACGVYNKCWMCPPNIGEISKLIQSVYKYKRAVVYNKISALEDSFDFEGMIEAKKEFSVLSKDIKLFLNDVCSDDFLFLGSGGCGVCNECAKLSDEPCRFPEIAIPSLEAYGIDVSALAKSSGMKYINGENTVTYFGIVLFMF